MGKTRTNEDLHTRAQAVFTPNYRPAPLVMDQGEGVYLTDLDGRRFLDLVSGIAVSALGHRHPDIVAAVQTQASKVVRSQRSVSGFRRTTRVFVATSAAPEMCSSELSTLPSHTADRQRLSCLCWSATGEGSRAQQISPNSSTSPR